MKKSPFPGMDPYLEQQGIWNQIHTNLIVAIQHALAPLIQPNYKVIIEQLTYTTLVSPNGDSKPPTSGKPDALITSPKTYQPSPAHLTSTTTAAPPYSITLPMPEERLHRYLEIRSKKDNVITTIEILSPSNKRGSGREQYLKKRNVILGSLSNLVEIDLLRGGKSLPMASAIDKDYRIIVSHEHYRPNADAYLFSLPDPIPNIPIPLRLNEEMPTLKLNDILHNVYQLGYYATLVNYDLPLEPSLNEEEAAWVKACLAQN